MPMHPTSFDLSPSRSSRSRSILSRLTSPLASRTRNLSEFYIRPDEPYRQYAPGDVVKGAVVLTVLKPVRVTHLVVRLHGHVRVFKTANAPGDGVYHDNSFIGTGRGKRGNECSGNGYASLFEDENTLCGEGRLDVGRYEFNFELDFPSKGVPSSIDFERGTISYMLTSTLTRPTTISPTSSCDRKIYLVETVDIAPLSQPKQRVISLKPISRERKAKNNAKSSNQPSTKAPSSRTISTEHSENPDSVALTEAQPHHQQTQSPAPSEISTRSVVSNSTRSSRLGPASSSAKDSDAHSSATSIADRTITATVELVRAGCLPGDLLPVKISINHTKPIKSLDGIIVTLYRQGRVDTHPAIPIGPIGKGKSEDYYPKSRTGLGGLSLSSAGSSSVFRKDLSQTFAPLIVDPNSLTAVVKPSVRVPEDAFPTIASVPGAMISFKYYVEVIVDLRGKLAAGQDSFLPRLGMTSVPTGSANSSHILSRDDSGTREIASTVGGSILDTDQIRRGKSVVACLFEVIVGTRDSGRKRTTRADWTQQAEYYPSFVPAPSVDARLPDGAEDHQSGGPPDGSHYLGPGNGSDQLNQYYTPPHESQPPTDIVPRPLVEDEDNMDEKTRIRRAEQRLLPSQPPVEDDSLSSIVDHRATAPELLGDASTNTITYLGDNGEFSTTGYAHGGPLAPSAETIIPFEDLQEQHDYRAGNEFTPNPTNSHPIDDKQELERRRLQVEASAPEDFPDDDENGNREANGGAVGTTFLEPSAPVLLEDEEYVQHNMGHVCHEAGLWRYSSTGESLPRYER
ncbi:MAG: ph-response sensor protein [Pleopsidium flavum]|nr:MAG: ph-response sensor protein [Pleopsidium flavum]KAI9874201.1 MAG: ph-response sensor protein [Pleopsidium flavum]